MKDNIEFLNFVHNLQDISKTAMDTIEISIELAEHEGKGYIVVPIGAAASLQGLLEIQTKFLNKLVEENVGIMDKLEEVIKKLDTL